MNYTKQKIISIIIWCALIGLTIFLSSIKDFINFWQGWEHISVLSTFCFNLVLIFLFFRKKLDSKITKSEIKAVYVIFLFILPAAILAFLNIIYVFTVVEIQGFISHVTLSLVTVVFLFYTIGDVVTYYHFKNNNKTTEMEEYWTNLVHLDIPFLISFFVLLIYYFSEYSSYSSLQADTQKILKLQLQSFVGGASAFQLILQNTVYTVKTNIFQEN